MGRAEDRAAYNALTPTQRRARAAASVAQNKREKAALVARCVAADDWTEYARHLPTTLSGFDEIDPRAYYAMVVRFEEQEARAQQSAQFEMATYGRVSPTTAMTLDLAHAWLAKLTEAMGDA